MQRGIEPTKEKSGNRTRDPFATEYNVNNSYHTQSNVFWSVVETGVGQTFRVWSQNDNGMRPLTEGPVIKGENGKGELGVKIQHVSVVVVFRVTMWAL